MKPPATTHPLASYPMRRCERALSYSETCEVLDKASYITIATTNEEGFPYGVPVSFVRRENTLYFHTGDGKSLKADCFKHDSRVSATAVTNIEPFYADGDFSTCFKSAIAFGRVREVQSNIECKRVLVDLCMKYAPTAKQHIGKAMQSNGPDTLIWAIDIEGLTGKSRPSF